MSSPFNERVEITNNRIFGSLKSVFTHFGVKSDDHYMSTHTVKEGAKVVGVSQHLQFKDQEQRDTILSIFEGVNFDNVAEIESVDVEKGDMPHRMHITVCGKGAFPEKNAYADMDKLTQAAVHVEPVLD